ncbi:MAG: hypothetical protein WA142_09940 [Rugosibacter sp.]
MALRQAPGERAGSGKLKKVGVGNTAIVGQGNAWAERPLGPGIVLRL